MQRICLLMVVLFSITLIAYGQGTPGVLRCSRGTFDIHASRDPGSAIVARIQCGTAVLLIDEQFGSYHLRLEDGTDGYIITRNFGQFTIQPEGEPISQSVPGRAPTSRPAVVTVPVAPNPSGGSEGFPRMEIFAAIPSSGLTCREVLLRMEATKRSNPFSGTCSDGILMPPSISIDFLD